VGNEIVQDGILTQSLNLRGLGIRLLLRILRLDFPSNNKLPHIILLCQSKELANLAGSLGSKAFGMSDVGKAR